jgi:hypothetical protein
MAQGHLCNFNCNFIALNEVQWQDCVNTVMNVMVPFIYDTVQILKSSTYVPILSKMKYRRTISPASLKIRLGEILKIFEIVQLSWSLPRILCKYDFCLFMQQSGFPPMGLKNLDSGYMIGH